MIGECSVVGFVSFFFDFFRRNLPHFLRKKSGGGRVSKKAKETLLLREKEKRRKENRESSEDAAIFDERLTTKSERGWVDEKRREKGRRKEPKVGWITRRDGSTEEMGMVGGPTQESQNSSNYSTRQISRCSEKSQREKKKNLKKRGGK